MQTHSTFIRSLPEHGSGIVHSAVSHDRQRLERVQRVVMRKVTGPPLLYPSRLHALGLCPLEVRCIRGDLRLLLNLLTSRLVGEFFNSSPFSPSRVRKGKFFKPRPRSFIRANFFMPRVISPLNFLSDGIAKSRHMATFGKSFDIHLGLTLHSPFRMIITPTPQHFSRTI